MATLNQQLEPKDKENNHQPVLHQKKDKLAP